MSYLMQWSYSGHAYWSSAMYIPRSWILLKSVSCSNNYNSSTFEGSPICLEYGTHRAKLLRNIKLLDLQTSSGIPCVLLTINCDPILIKAPQF